MQTKYNYNFSGSGVEKNDIFTSAILLFYFFCSFLAIWIAEKFARKSANPVRFFFFVKVLVFDHFSTVFARFFTVYMLKSRFFEVFLTFFRSKIHRFCVFFRCLLTFFFSEKKYSLSMGHFGSRDSVFHRFFSRFFSQFCGQNLRLEKGNFFLAFLLCFLCFFWRF
jgi:hypothetical protein